MIWDRETPCNSCPYRKDAPLKLWHRSEFENLLENDKPLPGSDISLGAFFGCHEFNKRPMAEHRPCAGWLLDQKRRQVPNAQLRLTLSKDSVARASFERVNTEGLQLYRTISAMCRANGVRRRKP